MGDGGTEIGSDYGAPMDIADIPEAIEWQAEHAHRAGAPGTAAVVRAMLAVVRGNTAVGRRMAAWQGLTLQDAMPLRLHGGLHHLLLLGADRRLSAVYSGEMTEQPAVDALVCELVETYDARLLPWLDGPPQTNEAGRSASIMAGLLWLAQHVPPRFRLFEIGSSAGVNTMLDRYRFELGGVSAGPADSPMVIAPDWRGPPPPAGMTDIVGIEGCDIAPIDLIDAEAALRLKGYVWPEAAERMGRIDAAIVLAQVAPPSVVKSDAADFVEAVLERPPESGVTRALFHSIVWQYIPEDRQQRITAAMERAGAAADTDTPLAWIALETNRETFAHELTVRYWPGPAEPVVLATAHPHGAWIEWRGSIGNGSEA
ncbi:MAG: DUF2332 domain-containing protein [Parerythrobacter sp.]